MTIRLRNSLLLRPSDIVPSHVGWEVIGVLNPAVALQGDDVVMLARVAERFSETRPGQTAIPRWQCDGDVAVDWNDDGDLQPIDARVVALRKTGALRLTSVSHLQVLRRSNKAQARWTSVVSILPETEFEEFGIEDPRITKIGDIFWVTYVAVSRHGACTALMSSTDLVTFKRHGVIFSSENKDVVLFPQTIDGDYLALHRPNPNSHFSPPSIWLARSPDLIHWGRHQTLMRGCNPWEGDRVGSGTPPILIENGLSELGFGEAGWLILYHGSESSRLNGKIGRYAAGAVLLDRYDPLRVIARTAEPIMTPRADFELNGFVPNVVFPTALIDLGETLQVYYGAADTCLAVAEFSKRAILGSMTSQIGQPL